MRISLGHDAFVAMGRAIREVIPEAAIESAGSAQTSYRVRVYSENPITLRQLKAVERIIGHERINLVPATYEGPLSDVTPGAGFERGFISFEWVPGGDS